MIYAYKGASAQGRNECKGDRAHIDNQTLVLRFCAFTGKLLDGYMMQHATKKRTGEWFHNNKAVIEFLSQHPDVRCEPIKV